mgnify:CR=1 FL=1
MAMTTHLETMINDMEDGISQASCHHQRKKGNNKYALPIPFDTLSAAPLPARIVDPQDASQLVEPPVPMPPHTQLEMEIGGVNRETQRNIHKEDKLLGEATGTSQFCVKLGGPLEKKQKEHLKHQLSEVQRGG